MGSLIKKAGVKGWQQVLYPWSLLQAAFMFYGKIIRGVTLFKPELFVKNRELQGNQIMFPEKEKYTAKWK